MKIFNHLPNYRYYDAEGTDSVPFDTKYDKLRNLCIYGNSVQNGTPTPETPVEVESVGEKTKNLLPNDWESGFISTSSGANQSLSTHVRTKDYFTFDIAKNYYISSDSIDTRTPISWYFYDENKNFISRFVSYKNRTIGTSGCQVTIPTNTVFFRLAVLTTDINIKVQIEEGSTATEYEPYGYKIPIKVSGKNLFDISLIPNTKNITNNQDGTLTIIASENSGGYCNTSKKLSALCPDLKVGDVCVLSGNTNGFKNNGNPLKYIYLSVTKQSWFFDTVKTISQTDLDSLVIVYGSEDTSETTISHIQVEKGTTVTPCEPYQEPKIYNIFLDEPLRKAGEYADYIDFKSGKLVRNIGVGIVSFTFYSFNASNGQLYLRTNMSSTDMLPDSLDCISNKIKTFKAFPGSADKSALMVSGGTFFYFVIAEESEQQTYIDLLADTEIYFVLKTPVETEIDLPDIDLHKGTNIITVETTTASSKIEVQYLN